MTHITTYEEGTDPIVDQIVNNLRQVYDPEIPINIYDLGLIYNIDVLGSPEVKILHTLTSAFCPAADQIVADINSAAISTEGVDKCSVETTFEPQWGPEMIPDHAKLEMGIL